MSAEAFVAFFKEDRCRWRQRSIHRGQIQRLELLAPVYISLFVQDLKLGQYAVNVVARTGVAQLQSSECKLAGGRSLTTGHVVAYQPWIGDIGDADRHSSSSYCRGQLPWSRLQDGADCRPQSEASLFGGDLFVCVCATLTRSVESS